MHLNAAPIISTFSCSCTTALMVQEQQWLLPREAYFSHMFLTFIPSNGPICLSKCVCCVLFPARFVPMLSLQWAPFSPGVRTEASRYLYRLNSWGPPSQRRVGERNYHGGFRLNQALDNSLCSFLSLFFKPSFFLSFFKISLPRHHFSLVCPAWPLQVVFVSGQHFMPRLSRHDLLVFIHSATDGFSPFSPLKRIS